MDVDIKVHKRKRAVISIDSVPFAVEAFLSFNDFQLLGGIDEQNTKIIFAQFVQKRIIDTGVQIPSIETIAAQDDSCFQDLIYALVADESQLKDCFEARGEAEPLCEWFVLSVKDVSEIWAKNIAKTLKDVVIPKIQQIKIPVETLEIIGGQLKQMAEAISSFVSSINEIWKQVSFPTISEERKEEIKQANIQWGKYGWTQPPASPFMLFNDAPDGANDANKIAGKYCTKDDMKELLSLLQTMKHVRREDLEEAVFDYQNRKYKSCALILFGLIDSRLIRLQRNEDRSKSGRRSSGAAAARKLSRQIENTHDLNNMFFHLLKYQNVSACLQKVFEDGNDFKNQPAVINRNFLDHGMLHRRVTKRDCTQLFLLYFNLLEMLEFISPDKEA